MDYFFYLLNVCKTQFESHEVNLESSGLLLSVLFDNWKNSYLSDF